MLNEFLNKCSTFFPKMQGVLEESWSITTNENALRPSARDKTWRAKTMSGHMRAGLCEQFPGYVREHKGTFYLEIGIFRIYCHKLSKSLRPSRAKTLQAKQIQGFCQYSLSLFPMENPSFIPVYFGYTLDATEDNISGIYFVKFSSGKPEWTYPLQLARNGVVVNHSANAKLLVRWKNEAKRQRKIG